MELSSTVQQYQQVTRDTTSQIEQRAEKNAVQILTLLSPYLATGEVIPELRILFVLLSRHIQRHQQTIEAADQLHAQELGDDAAVLLARDNAASALYSEMTQLRSEIEATFGASGISALGMTGETPRTAPLLERYAADVLDRLQKGVNLGTPLRKRTTFDQKAAAEDLIPLCNELKAAIANVTKEVAEAKETLDAKNLALLRWDSNVPPAIAAAKALFVLAGDSEGAARLYSTPLSYRKSASTTEPSL
jgi:hypothetical protein